jgi:arylsulfatase A-like enzyme
MLLDSGLMDDTWVVLTSDHGEMFERGIWEHHGETVHQPLVHIPLIISAPGQQVRQDVYSVTSAVDLLPTLLHLSGKAVPSWCQGVVMPPFGEAGQRSIYALEAKQNPEKLGPLTTATSMLVDWPYKLVMYTGYDRLAGEDPLYELYDLENDPKEMENLYPGSPGVVEPMLEALQTRINRSDDYSD